MTKQRGYPDIDYRSRKEILQNLRKYIVQYTKAWKDITELENDEFADGIVGGFTQMFQKLQERLNAAPEKNHLAFLNMLGLNLMPPRTSRTPVAFFLSEGSSSWARIPAGTQVAADPAKVSQPVIFETTEEITAILPKPVFAASIQPSEDSYAIHRNALFDVKDYKVEALFDGKKALDHRCYLSHPGLAELKPGDIVEVHFGESSVFDKAQIRWLYFDADLKSFVLFRNASVEYSMEVPPKKVSLTLEKTPGETKLKGVSLEYGSDIETEYESQAFEAKGVFIAFENNRPLTKDDEIALASVKLTAVLKEADNSTVTHVVGNIGAAFYNSAAIDLSKDFFPFGQRPRFNDSFYFACDEVLSQANGKEITIQFTRNEEVEPYAAGDVQLQWEYYNGTNWTVFNNSSNDPVVNLVFVGVDAQEQVTVETIETIKHSFTDIKPVKVNGKEHLWIRSTIVSGHYGEDTSFLPPPDTTIIPVGKDAPIINWIFTPATWQAPCLENIQLSYELESVSEFPEKTITCNNFFYTDVTELNNGQTPQLYKPFWLLHDETPTFYLAFSHDFSSLPVAIFFSILRQDKMTQLFSQAKQPPQVLWEYWDGAWKPLQVTDKTAHLCERELLQFYGPEKIQKQTLFEKENYYWIRGRQEREELSIQYRIDGIYTNVAWARQCKTVAGEILGSGNGQPSQKILFKNAPVLEGEKIYVREDHIEQTMAYEYKDRYGEDAIIDKINNITGKEEKWVLWMPVDHFYFSSANDRHYTIDRISGTVVFGDNRRGRMPGQGKDNIICKIYKYGGGAFGNLTAGTVTKLRTAIPYVNSIVNFIPAYGGEEGEDTEALKARGPVLLKSGGRAVTQEDLESMVLLSSSRVARVKCMSVTDIGGTFHPGYVTLLVLPQTDSDKPALDKDTIDEIEKYLEPRIVSCLAAANPKTVNLVSPDYVSVSVKVEILRYTDIQLAKTIEKNVVESLYNFFHPLKGGPKGRGWPFGRNISMMEVSQLVEKIPGVAEIKNIYAWVSMQQFQVLPVNNRFVTQDFPKHSSVELTFRVFYKTDQADFTQYYYIGGVIRKGSILSQLVILGFKEGDRLELVAESSTMPPGQGGATEPVEVVLIESIDIGQVTVAQTLIKKSYPVGTKVRSIDGKVQSYLLTALDAGEISSFEISTPVKFDTDDLQLMTKEFSTIQGGYTVSKFFTLTHRENDRVSIGADFSRVIKDISLDDMTEVFLEDNYVVCSKNHEVKKVT